MIRPPAVAGLFYSASAPALEDEVARYLDSSVQPKPVIAAVSPHAGLMYSGPVAGSVYSRIALPETVILVGPNHTGIGPAVSVYPEGAWQMPGGAVSVDRDLVQDMLAHCPHAEADTSAHQREHCLEVQLPFLQSRRRPIRIVPLVLGVRDPALCRIIGESLAAIVARHRNATGERPLLLASTDMNHYESDAVTREKDRHAITAIEHLDPEGLDAAVTSRHISMCGIAPTLAVLHAARSLGATGATLVRYATSGDRSGDRTRVVGYAGLII
jgi:AmmeMemoRadiSam system protein B